VCWDGGGGGLHGLRLYASDTARKNIKDQLDKNNTKTNYIAVAQHGK